MSLHKLSNGSWIAITVGERQQCWRDGPIHADRVIVAYGENYHIVLPCDDFKQAQEMADELAGHVNACCLTQALTPQNESKKI